MTHENLTSGQAPIPAGSTKHHANAENPGASQSALPDTTSTGSPQAPGQSESSHVKPDPNCPRGRVYEQAGAIYAHPEDIAQANRDGWHMVFPR